MRTSLASTVLLASLTASAAPSGKTLTVTSPAFAANGAIPAEFTCDGEGKTPPLSWSNVPAPKPSTSRGPTSWVIVPAISAVTSG